MTNETKTAVLSKLRAPVAPGDERTAFEHHARACDLTRDEDEPDEYRNSHVQEYWNGWKARAALASAPVAMIDTAKLAQLLDSVNGDCYLGKEKEEDLVQSLRSQLRARVAEPEWIDDPHDIEQGMMRNPKYVAPGHKPVDTSSGHSAPVADERTAEHIATLQRMRADYNPGNGPASELKAAALDAAIAAMASAPVAVVRDNPEDYGTMIDALVALPVGTQLYAAPQPSADAARAIHWPDCWDTTAYPTVESALSEVYATFRCTNQVTCAALDAHKEHS